LPDWGCRYSNPRILSRGNPEALFQRSASKEDLLIKRAVGIIEWFNNRRGEPADVEKEIGRKISQVSEISESQ
jgi:hypothetical protein